MPKGADRAELTFSDEELRQVIDRALQDEQRGLGAQGLCIEPALRDRIAERGFDAQALRTQTA